MIADDKNQYVGTFAGTWEMVAMSDGTDVLSVDSREESQRASVESKVTLNEDGTMVFTTMGTDVTGTWAPTTDAEIVIKLDANENFEGTPSYVCTLEDGTLAINEDGLVMLLEKAA